MPRRMPVAVTLLVGGLLVTGCGSAAQEPGSTTGAGPTTSAGTTSAGPSQTTITGVVDGAAVEGRCVVLRTPGKVYLLVGDTTTLVSGEQATVTGHPEPALQTTCQLGLPFRVQRIDRASHVSPGYAPR
jgi:hypothetical protein